jgi:hypothetical protein
MTHEAGTGMRPRGQGHETRSRPAPPALVPTLRRRLAPRAAVSRPPRPAALPRGRPAIPPFPRTAGEATTLLHGAPATRPRRPSARTIRLRPLLPRDHRAD